MAPSSLENLSASTEVFLTALPCRACCRLRLKGPELPVDNVPRPRFVLTYSRLKLEDEDNDPPAPLLACGHRWTGAEPWEDMLVILKEEMDGRAAYSTGHWCRLCRMRRDSKARRLNSVAKADAWLRSALP